MRFLHIYCIMISFFAAVVFGLLISEKSSRSMGGVQVYAQQQELISKNYARNPAAQSSVSFMQLAQCSRNSVEQQEVSSNIPPSKASSPLLESGAEQNAKMNLARVERFVAISDEQRSRLYAMYLAEARLSTNFSTLDDYKDIETLEDILGSELSKVYSKAESDLSEKLTQFENEKEAAFVARELNLTKEQEEKLVGAYTNPDRTIEKEVIYLSRILALSKEQENNLRPIIFDTFNTEATYNETGEMESFRIGGTEIHNPHIDGSEDVTAEYLRDRIKPILTEEQYNKFISFQSSKPQP